MGDEECSAIDLFSGAGGFSTGLQWAGFDIKWAADNDEKAAKTYQHNHPEVPFALTDLSELDPSEVEIDLNEPLDLIAGGPPCPTFSIVGRAKMNSIDEQDVTEDSRHQLWQDFVRFVDHFQPRAFVMENVKGMYSAENDAGQRVLPIILDEMRDAGYRVDASVVNAVDFGVPQNRERLFIIGNQAGTRNPNLAQWETHREPQTSDEKKARLLDDLHQTDGQRTLGEYTKVSAGGEDDDPRPTRRVPWITVAEAILDLPPLSPAGSAAEDPHPPADETEYHVRAVTKYQKWARNIPDDESWEDQQLHNHEARFHNLTDLSIYKLLGEGTGWRINDLGDDLQPYRADVFEDNYTKQSPSEPSSTIPAHLHKDGHMHIHPSEARSFTVREAARIQSFRDTYHFPVSRTAAYKQVGNAVPPLLAECIGLAIREETL